MSVDAKIKSLVDALDNLNHLHQFAFGLCALERAVPLFFEFAAESGHRGSGEVLAALASCWRYLEADAESRAGFVSVPGRLLLFNGTMQHVARPPSRDCPHLRVTLMYKFRFQERELV